MCLRIQVRPGLSDDDMSELTMYCSLFHFTADNIILFTILKCILKRILNPNYLYKYIFIKLTMEILGLALNEQVFNVQNLVR